MSDTVTMLIELTEKLFEDTTRLEARVKELEELLETQEIDFDWMMMAKRLLMKFRDCETITDIDEEELETLLEEPQDETNT